MSTLAMIPQDVSINMRKRKDLDGDAEEQMPAKTSYMSKAREIRLEQNRKAARESRRRKKSMVEELQRSVIFFSRANGTLKHQNDELTRLLAQAEAQVAVIEAKDNSRSASSTPMEQVTSKAAADKSQAQDAYVLAAARATGASTPTKAEPSAEGLPQMQPGATMQAMANFQQAATVAMQAAVQGMKTKTLAAPAPAPKSAQQIFNETMAAVAMQQAAVAAVSGQQFMSNPFMGPMLAWQNQQLFAAMAQAGAAFGNNNNAPKKD